MKYVEKQKINTIFNLGDFVQIGPNPYEVSNIILNDRRFINILGNNETSLFKFEDKIKNEEIGHRIWTKEQLKENYKKIINIPTNKKVEIEKMKILLIHSRKDNIKGMPIIYSTNIEEFAMDYEEFDSNIVLFGHTHEKMFIEYNNKMFINPGSLGCSKAKKVDFAILKIDNGKVINCEFKSLEYDKSKVLLEFEKQDIPDKKFIITTFFMD